MNICDLHTILVRLPVLRAYPYFAQIVVGPCGSIAALERDAFDHLDQTSILVGSEQIDFDLEARKRPSNFAVWPLIARGESAVT